MSSQSSCAPELMETGFAKTYQVLPSASLMAAQFDNLFASSSLFADNNRADNGAAVENKFAGDANNQTLRDMYGDNNVVRLKRTARALASLNDEDDEKNFVTCDKLPSIASPLVLSVGTSQTKLQAMPVMQAPVRRRNLLPAPKTNMLPISSATELRAIIRESHSKRQEQIAHRKTRQGMQSAPRARKRSGKPTGIWANLKAMVTKPLNQLSNLLDQLALA